VILLAALLVLSAPPVIAADRVLPSVSGYFQLGELHPHDLAVSLDGTRLFVVASVPGEADSGEVRILATDSGKDSCPGLKVRGEPAGVALSPDGLSGYAANTGDGYHVTRFRTAPCEEAGSARSGSGPEGVAFSAGGGRVFVANNWESYLTVFDATWRDPLARIEGFGAGATRLAATPDGRYVYAAGRTGKVLKIDTASLLAGRPLPVNAADLAVSPDGRFVYAAVTGAQAAITAIATTTDDIVFSVPLETGVQGLAVLPGGRYLYAALPKLGQVAVIDLDAATDVARVRVGAGPRRLAASPDGRTVFVACAADTRIAVIGTADYGRAEGSTRLTESRVRAAAESPPAPTRTFTGGVTTMAVADLDAQGVTAASAAVVTDWLRGELVQTGAFDVLERKNMTKILAEQAIQQTGCTDQDCAVRLGRLLNVQRMLVGSLGKFEDSYVVNVRVVDIETGRAVASDTSKGASIDDVEAAVKVLARRIARSQ